MQRKINAIPAKKTSGIIAIMKIPVRNMEKCGVLNRLLTFANTSGTSWSRLIAMGKRDADSIPAFAVEKNARMPATPMTTLPTVPRILFPPVDMGVKERVNSWPSSKPTVTKIVSP